MRLTVERLVNFAGGRSFLDRKRRCRRHLIGVPVKKSYKKKILGAMTVVCVILFGLFIFLENQISHGEAPLNRESILYVGGYGNNNYTHIQDAINDASPGDLIYVYEGVYTERIFIDKQITLEGQRRDIAIIDGDSIGDVVTIQVSNVEIIEFTITNSGIWHTGIILDFVNGIEISHCSITDNYNGMKLLSASSNIIIDNVIENSTNTGIELDGYCNNNTIVHNNFKNNNPDNAYDEGYDNSWDIIPVNEGNYWDDYTGIDDDGNGIGDIPYYIPGGTSVDYYPLMTEYQWIGGDKPVAYLEYIINGTTVFLNASQSYDSDGVIVSYEWSFGDGETDTGVVVSHTYDADDTYTIILQVTDNDGTNDSESITLFLGIDIYPPRIADNTPPIGYTGDSFIFNATLVDIPVASNTFVDSTWIEYWYTGGSHTKTGMVNAGGDYWIKMITLHESHENLYYIISANDTCDNWNNTIVKYITIHDNDKPKISNVLDIPDPQESGGYINTTCMVSDNRELQLVKVNISSPDFTTQNISMINIEGTTIYYYNISYIPLGIYLYRVYAVDTEQNANLSPPFTFSIITGDANPPRFMNISLSLSNIPEDSDGVSLWGETTNISVEVFDDSTVTEVIINLTPIGHSCCSMINKAATNIWYIHTNASIGSAVHEGSSYIPRLLTIIATDEYGNWNITHAELTVWKNGDVSGNGGVNLYDATYLARYLVSLPGYETTVLGVADVSGNGNVNLYDATYLARHLVGLVGYEVLH